MPTLSSDAIATLRVADRFKQWASDVADDGPLQGRESTQFWADAATLANRITARLPKLDPSPIIELATLDPAKPMTRESRWALADRAVALVDLLESAVTWDDSHSDFAGPARPAGPPADPQPLGTVSDRVPSVYRLAEACRALWWFAISRKRPENRYTFEEEDGYLVRFVGLADALRPIRPLFGGFNVWPDRVERDLRALCEAFDRTAQSWKWEAFAAPEAERSRAIDARRRWRVENRERPMYEAAISGEAAFDGTERESEVRDIADRGRDLKYGPTMTVEEGKALYPDAIHAWKRLPYLSDVRPVIADAEREAFSRAWMNLRAALQALSPSLVAAIEDTSIPTGPSVGSSPPVGSDGPTDRPEAASEQPARRPEGDPVPAGPPGSPREDRQAAGPDASGSKASPPSVDYEDLATKLRKQGKGTQAALVEYMADKPKAKGEEIARHVHGDPETSDRAMWNNAKRTSDSLTALGSPLSFRFASGWMFRDISPE